MPAPPPLINCPECQKEISDQAPACPNCGYPTKQKEISIEVKKDGKENESKPGALFHLFLFVIVCGLIYMFTYNSHKYNIPANNTITQSETNDNAKEAADYTGTYHDLDQSTGWETTVRITGNYFSAVTVSIMTGEIIASTSGELKGSNLIDEYGQSVGSVSNYYASINVGAAHIQCNKQ